MRKKEGGRSLCVTSFARGQSSCDLVIGSLGGPHLFDIVVVVVVVFFFARGVLAMMYRKTMNPPHTFMFKMKKGMMGSVRMYLIILTSRTHPDGPPRIHILVSLQFSPSTYSLPDKNSEICPFQKNLHEIKTNNVLVWKKKKVLFNIWHCELMSANSLLSFSTRSPSFLRSIRNVPDIYQTFRANLTIFGYSSIFDPFPR